MALQVVEDAAGAAASLGAAAPTLVVLAAVSLVMVAAMVRFSRAVIAGRGAPAWRWGVVYLASWAVLIALFLRLMALTGKEIGGRNLALLALVTGSWLGVNAVLIALARAIERANARSATPQAAASTARPAPAALPRRRLREPLALVRNVAVALAVIAVGELVPPLRALELYLAGRRTAWVVAAGAVAALGLVLLVGGGIHMVLTASAGDEASFAEVKAAWRSGAWRRSVRWRRLFAMAAGGALLLFGLFGLIFVIGPPGVKLLAAAAVAYAVARTVRGWVRA